jgi:DNA mismatch repair protein MutL
MIELLPVEVRDQIAAGEVVERPAHMVKELIENSLDAHATQITIKVKNSGRSVEIQDNGQGIESAQLGLALDRFATSKIRSSDDLWKLKTYGFRGEALASLAAVSELTLISRTAKAKQASQI